MNNFFIIKSINCSFGKTIFLKSAFTLVEIIVVITILSILSTVSFFSINGYAKQSRDSIRVSDLAVMKTSLGLFQSESGKFPIPSNGVDITYSGSNILYQGTFGESVFVNLDIIDKLPLDPISNKEYTYTVTNNRNEYELAGIIEGDSFANNNYLVFRVIAGNIEAKAIVIGNYNGVMLRSIIGNTCDVLSLPSIIASDFESSTNLNNIILNKKLVYNGYKNLPSSFLGSKFNQYGGFDFLPNNLVSYNDDNKCEQLIDKTSNIARLELLKGLKDSYNGTIIDNEGEIKKLVKLDIDVLNPSEEVKNFAGSFVNNYLGGKIIISGLKDTILYQCDGLLGSGFNDDTGSTNYGVDFLDFDLCNNNIKLNNIYETYHSSNLTMIDKSRDVYSFFLEKGKNYEIETLGEDEISDTVIYLYDKVGNKLLMNDDIDAFNKIYRSKINFTTSYTGYYFIGVMGYNDEGTLADYSLIIR